MIGLLLLPIAVMMFMFLGYVILLGNLYLIMLTLTVYAFAGLASISIFSALWEWWFPKPAKTLIANKRAAGFELAVDDIGWGEILPSKSYMPEGLVRWKFGWSLLPRPVQKLGIVEKVFKRKSGRKHKNPDEAKNAEAAFQAKQKQERMLKEMEREMAEQIGLKRVMLKGLGKPLWLQYVGLAGNFNPYVLVPLEAKQDNPHIYFTQMEAYIDGLQTIGNEAKQQLKEKLEECKKRVESIRVVLDTKRFKEIHPTMYAQSQLDALGAKYFEWGKLSVEGMPLGKILLVLLILAGVFGGIFILYYFFMRSPPPPV